MLAKIARWVCTSREHVICAWPPAQPSVVIDNRLQHSTLSVGCLPLGLPLSWTSGFNTYGALRLFFSDSPGMAFRKPKKNAKKVIDREGFVGGGTAGRTGTVVAHNFYEAGPSGVEFTDRVLEVELQDNPRPAKQVRLHSPPRVTASTPSTIDHLSSLDGLVPSPFPTNPLLSFTLPHHFPSPQISTGE